MFEPGRRSCETLAGSALCAHGWLGGDFVAFQSTAELAGSAGVDTGSWPFTGSVLAGAASGMAVLG
jgi:hypothetical protein